MIVSARLLQALSAYQADKVHDDNPCPDESSAYLTRAIQSRSFGTQAASSPEVIHWYLMMSCPFHAVQRVRMSPVHQMRIVRAGTER